MGDVRIPALATLLAAVIAVAGSIYVVWRNGRQQLRIQRAEFAEQAAVRGSEQRRAAWTSEVEACVAFDAAVAMALGRLRTMVGLVGRPAVRRRLLGPAWAQQWHREVFEAAAEFAVPLSRVRLTARPSVRDAVSAVADAFEVATTAVSSIPLRVPEVLLAGPLGRPWRARVDAAIEAVQAARRDLAEVLEETAKAPGDQPSFDSNAARS
ncbi:hypothetical protein [Blastococcus sp. TF02A-26]|uniref:hypothetical protein n=1 Tax=Blastococcus sp. TF02A-26 TaxID=2250577 RepID=UPI000DE9D2FD|nr:hypothetical protein [Blastococcus sp. TF02A-26]RBY87457.1 hypothetical protein DQ240_07680 [Blastococcus sp. TF02A-26]